MSQIDQIGHVAAWMEQLCCAHDINSKFKKKMKWNNEKNACVRRALHLELPMGWEHIELH